MWVARASGGALLPLRRGGMYRIRKWYCGRPLEPMTAHVGELSGFPRRRRGRDRFFCGTTRLFRQPKSRSDCRLQTAELRPGELQFPPVRIQDFLNDGKAQARSAASLVQADILTARGINLTILLPQRRLRLYSTAVTIAQILPFGSTSCEASSRAVDYPPSRPRAAR